MAVRDLLLTCQPNEQKIELGMTSETFQKGIHRPRMDGVGRCQNQGKVSGVKTVSQHTDYISFEKGLRALEAQT